MPKILIAVFVLCLSWSCNDAKASSGADVDSLESDMEFIIYISGLARIRDKATIESFLDANGWKEKIVISGRACDSCYVYNGGRRITLDPLLRDSDIRDIFANTNPKE